MIAQKRVVFPEEEHRQRPLSEINCIKGLREKIEGGKNYGKRKENMFFKKGASGLCLSYSSSGGGGKRLISTRRI